MCHDSFRPTREELTDRCDLCGEELERDECVTLGCVRYEASMGRFPTDVERVGVRWAEWFDDESEVA